MSRESDTSTASQPQATCPAGEGRTVAVSGASGLVGTALVRELTSAGYRIRRLVRRPVRDPDREITWDPAAGRVDPEDLRGVQAVFNLAGRPIAAARWTDTIKRQIRDSRVQGSAALARAVAALTPDPPVLVNASAIGYYGDRGTEPLDETSSAGQGFLSETTQAWEAATGPAADAGARVVKMRFGVVLSAEGGALAKMLTPFRLGLGGRLGDGRQLVSWIGLEDLVAALVFVLERPELEGPVNAVAPGPVTNAELTRTLASVLSRPAILPLPEFAIDLLMGEMGRELLLSSAYVIPRRLEAAGFEFRQPSLESLLRAELG